MKVYGAEICPDCVMAKRILDQKNLPYKYIDITEDTGKMKEFLRLRDSRKEYESIKQEGRIGIPTFLFNDGRISFNLYELNFDDIKEDSKLDSNSPENIPGLCGLDGC